MQTIVFTVTNELNYDQRMQRICHSLAKNGYSVRLVGRKKTDSRPLQDQSFQQKRLSCIFQKGPFFYIEFNIKLLFYLLNNKADCYCAIDLDTILPVYFASLIKGTKRVYDAHEYFTEQKEIIRRPAIQKIWSSIEAFAIPRFPHGYTVNQWIANTFKALYGVKYRVIRNLPKSQCNSTQQAETAETIYDKPNASQSLNNKLTNNATNAGPIFLIYQGAVNEGRCFETLIPAMKQVDSPLHIYGTGNFIKQSLSIINELSLNNKISILNPLFPEELQKITPTAYAGITLFEAEGANQYHSLANRFFDYIMAGIPQLCVDYPEYRTINQQFEVAYLIKDTRKETIADGLNKLLHDPVLYQRLKQNCFEARKIFNWEQEELVLLDFYQHL